MVATLTAQPTYTITNADKKRIQDMHHAWKAYTGDLDAPLEKMRGQPDDNVLSNRCKPIVDRGVDFLFGKEIEISASEKAPARTQKILDKVWGRKEARLPLLQKLAINGALAGSAFLRIVPFKDSFRLVVIDPQNVFVKTDPQDCEVVTQYCIEYTADAAVGSYVQPITFREEITRIDPMRDDYPDGEDQDADGIDEDVTWEITYWKRIGAQGQWLPTRDPVQWNYPFSPMFSCQNLPQPNTFWGFPDITPDLIGLNKALNLLQSNINRVQKLYGQPFLFSVGTGEQDLVVQPGVILQLPTLDSKIESVPIVNDTANGLAFAANLRSDIDELSSVPGVATGRISELPRGTMSGIAIELLFMALLKKTDKKACLYGELILNVSKAILYMSGIKEDVDITIAWQNPLPHDDLPSVQAALQKKQIGISDATLQRELGYDPDEELALSQTEDALRTPPALQPFVAGSAPTPTQKPGMTAEEGMQNVND